MVRISGLLLLCCLLCQAALAIGSFRLADLEPLLARQPGLRAVLFDGFDLETTGWAERIGNAANARLGGTRIGPYHLYAKPKGSAGPYALEVVLHTQCTYFDQAGKACALADAVRLEEAPVSLEVRPVPPGEQKPAPTTPIPLFVADRLYYVDPQPTNTPNLALTLCATFPSAAALHVALRPGASLVTWRGKPWTLYDILIAVDTNGNGYAAEWKVSGPEPVIAYYRKTLERALADKHLVDFSVAPLFVKPTAAMETEDQPDTRHRQGQ